MVQNGSYRQLATDIATLTGSLGHAMSLAVPHLKERRDLSDFIGAQPQLREALAAHCMYDLRAIA